MKKCTYIINCNIFLIIFIMAGSFRLQACGPVGGHSIIKNQSGSDIYVSYSLDTGKKGENQTLSNYKQLTIKNNGSKNICWRTKVKKRYLSMNLLTFVTADKKSKLNCSVHVHNEVSSLSGRINCTGQATGEETLELVGTNCVGPYAALYTICEVTVKKVNQTPWPFKNMDSLF